jgi:acyl-CoA synthetase (AMP-forming)/AMP-acid ligase II
VIAETSTEDAPSNLVSMLQARARERPAELAFRFLTGGEADDQVLTFSELDQEARWIGADLVRRGRTGVAVLLYAPGLEFLAAFFGCLYAGVLPTAANLSLAPGGLKKIASILRSSGARTVLANSAHLPRFRRALASEVDVEQLAWIATDEIELVSTLETVRLRPDGLAFLQYSSGTTGAEKGIAISHGNILHNLELLRASFNPTRSDVCVSWLPHFHDMGLIAGLLHSLYSAIPCILMSPGAFLRRPADWLAAISTHKGTLSGGPNFGYEHCIARIAPAERRQLDLSSWTVAISGAEPVRSDTLRRFVEAFGGCGFRRSTFYPTYGLAEATLMVSGGWRGDGPFVLPVHRIALEKGRAETTGQSDCAIQEVVGCGPPRTEVRIVDPATGAARLEGQSGEILVAGASVAQGYWCGDDQPLAPLVEDVGPGLLRTGDLGFICEGQLFVTGRLKDLIILHGRNIHPQDVEDTARAQLAMHERLDACAFSIEHDREERLVVVIEADQPEEGPSALAPLVERVRGAIWRHHEVAIWALLVMPAGRLPKTSSGKLQRSVLREDYLQGRLAELPVWGSAVAERTSQPAFSAAP